MQKKMRVLVGRARAETLVLRIAPFLGLGIATMGWLLFEALGYRSWLEPSLVIPGL